MRAIKKILSAFAFQMKGKAIQDIYKRNQALSPPIRNTRLGRSSDIISEQQTAKNKMILYFLYRFF